MHKISAPLFMMSMKLEAAKGLVAISEDGREKLAHVVDEFIKQCQRLPMSTDLVAQAQRLRHACSNPPWTDVTLMALTQDLQQAFMTVLERNLFFAIWPLRIDMYLDPREWFGDYVLRRFPDISRDVDDACQSFAVAQWTAAVFHSMRILERGLRAMGKHLSVPFAADVELENWKPIIDQIESHIRAMEALPKSAQKVENLKFYSEAATQFRYFKDAWRNHVSHSRTNYDDRSAETILTHVRDFMRDLAKAP